VAVHNHTISLKLKSWRSDESWPLNGIAASATLKQAWLCKLNQQIVTYQATYHIPGSGALALATLPDQHEPQWLLRCIDNFEKELQPPRVGLPYELCP
jgi:hypothetical protein